MSIIRGIIDEHGFPAIPEVTIINQLNNTAVKPSAIVDTGAAGLHIKADIIDLLKLERVDVAYSLHPIEGRQPVDIFQVAIEIQGIAFGLIPVRTMLDNFPFDLIIGCSFLQDRKMVYDGINKTIEIIL